MKDERDLSTRYGDLLGAAADADLLAVVARLDSALAPREEPSSRLIGAIDRRATRLAREVAAPCRRWRLPRPSRRLAPAFAALAVVTLSGAGYVYPAVERALRLNAQTASMAERRQGSDLNLARGAEGFAMTIRRANADRNRIVIAYTLHGPSARRFNTILPWSETRGGGETPGPEVPVLRTADGTTLRGELREEIGGVPDGNTLSGILLFRSPPLRRDARQVEVELVVPGFTAVEQLEKGSIRSVQVESDLRFRFTIPVDAAAEAVP